MSTEKITFTNDSIRKLTCPSGRTRAIYYDKKSPKLACVVSKTSIKTFALHAFDKTRKKPFQKTIGRYPDISINQARDIVSKLLAKLADGVDVIKEAQIIRDEPTFNDIFASWFIRAKLRNKTWKDSERIYRLHIKPTFGTKRISAITSQQVKAWHSNLLLVPKQRSKDSKKCLTQASANRCLALMRTIFNEEVTDLNNPCSKIKHFEETSRERFLQPDEIKVFFECLNSESTDKDFRDFIHLLLFTGARRSNVQSMTWEEIDFTTKKWTIPANKSKNKKNMTLPVVNFVMDILNRRRIDSTSKYVFEGNGKTGHLVEPKRAWHSLLKKAGISNLRLHDLRRTCGSYQAAEGTNQFIISKSLGHESLASTAVYARLNLDPVRESLEKAAAAIITLTEAKKDDG